MGFDILAFEGVVLLGSRLKRLAERLQGGAELISRDVGIDIQPSQLALMTALTRSGPLAVGDAARALGISQPGVTRMAGQLQSRGLVSIGSAPDDRRSRVLALTAEGQSEIEKVRTLVWPRIRAAVSELGAADELLDGIASLEKALDSAPLERRPSGGLALRAFCDELAPHFDRINREWITTMYALEPVDREQLEHPRRAIIDGGGEILFVEHPDAGIIGTGALLQTAPREFELVKMGVTASARGKRAGALLLAALIERAYAKGCDTLFLLTNRKSEAAIHLYEKHGFVHDADILARYGGEYARCDVAMRHRGPRSD